MPVHKSPKNVNSVGQIFYLADGIVIENQGEVNNQTQNLERQMIYHQINQKKKCFVTISEISENCHKYIFYDRKLFLSQVI